ncbi:MAG: hypothetical protein RLY86_3868 [Pseudomonadota bacterium]|jgi:putative transcriptional regulator
MTVKSPDIGPDDPADVPLSDDEFARGRFALRVRRLRSHLGLDQRGFASRFGIPLGTPRDWEQGKALPDQATQSYLTVIERIPDAVAQSLTAA